MSGNDPWGRDEPPFVAEADLEPLPPALAEIEAMLEEGEDRSLAPGERYTLPSIHDLPEGAALVDEGWEPLPIGFMGSEWALLPAAWPPEHRRWVSDRMPRFGLMSYGDDEPWPTGGLPRTFCRSPRTRRGRHGPVGRPTRLAAGQRPAQGREVASSG